MDIWHSAQPEKEIVTTGWLGRYFDNTCSGSDPHVGVSIGERLPLAMQGQRIMPLSFERTESYRYNGPDAPVHARLNKPDESGEMIDPPQPPAKNRLLNAARGKQQPIEITPASQLDFLHRTAMDAQVSSDEILRMTTRHVPAASYPGGAFGAGLRTIAAMIGGGLPTRVYYVALSGFDTHANQKGRHDNLMTQLAAGVSAFWQDMEKQGNADRVMMMTFSEFGRRVQQNASQGTDHGAAAPMLMLGTSLKRGIVGRHPSLTDLDQGDLKYTLDFRSVYATLLQEWLDTPSKPILGQQFRTLPIIRA
jgi:uncharacterized protein (DUF1501 family)